MHLRAALAFVALACGCSPAEGDGPADLIDDAGSDAPVDAAPDAPTGCMLAFVGDPAKDPVIEIIALTAEGPSTKVVDGGNVAMIFPPDAGFVIFAGVRAMNVDPCAVKLTGTLGDPATKQARLEMRVVNLVPLADGWSASSDEDWSSFTNIPVCPNQWSPTDIYGTEYELTLSLTDRSGRRATQSLHVFPSCAEQPHLAECKCTCKAGYVLDEHCEDADAGTDDASTGDAAGAGGASP